MSKSKTTPRFTAVPQDDKNEEIVIDNGDIAPTKIEKIKAKVSPVLAKAKTPLVFVSGAVVALVGAALLGSKTSCENSPEYEEEEYEDQDSYTSTEEE